MSDLNKLEAEVALERAQLTSALDELTNTLSPDHIGAKLTSSVEGFSGEIGRQAWGSAKQNPAAFALLAAGLGLLFSGGGTRPEAAHGIQANDPMDAMDGFDERVAAADAAMKSKMASESVVPKASWMRSTLESGIDNLPPAARTRVVRARRAAIAAQEKVEAQAAAISSKSRSFHNAQPIAVGALALGVGALIGALLPATRREDEFLGHQRDAMMDKAQGIFRMEMANLSDAAREGVSVAANRARSSRPARGNHKV